MQVAAHDQKGKPGKPQRATAREKRERAATFNALRNLNEGQMKTHKQRIAQRQLAEPYLADPEQRRSLEHESLPFTFIMEVFGWEKPSPSSVRKDYRRLRGLLSCVQP